MGTTRESDRQGSSLLERWFPARDHQQENGKKPGESSNKGNSPRRLRFWLRWLLFVFLINLLFYGPLLFSLLSAPSTTINLSYSRFLQQVEQGNVTSVTINSDDSVTGTFKTPVRQPPTAQPTAQPTGAANGSVVATHFTTLIPATGE